MKLCREGLITLYTPLKIVVCRVDSGNRAESLDGNRSEAEAGNYWQRNLIIRRTDQNNHLKKKKLENRNLRLCIFRNSFGHCLEIFVVGSMVCSLFQSLFCGYISSNMSGRLNIDDIEVDDRCG